MSDLDNLIAAAKQGNLERVNAILGADNSLVNQKDESGATPAGWAIEYFRELGGHLAIELDDHAHAIQLRDTRWVARFLKRFPSLRQASDTKGTPFQRLARESGDPEIARLFGLEDVVC